MFIDTQLPSAPAEGRIVTRTDAYGVRGELPDGLTITAVFADGEVQQIPLTREHGAALVNDLRAALSTRID